MVNLLLAVESCVSCGALAEVSSVRVVSASATVGAGPISTRHGTQLAVVAIETVRASAGICVLQILWVKNRTGFDIKICLAAAAASNCTLSKTRHALCCGSFDCFFSVYIFLKAFLV